jgi:hypothetical protein
MHFFVYRPDDESNELETKRVKGESSDSTDIDEQFDIDTDRMWLEHCDNEGIEDQEDIFGKCDDEKEDLMGGRDSRDNCDFASSQPEDISTPEPTPEPTPEHEKVRPAPSPRSPPTRKQDSPELEETNEVRPTPSPRSPRSPPNRKPNSPKTLEETEEDQPNPAGLAPISEEPTPDKDSKEQKQIREIPLWQEKIRKKNEERRKKAKKAQKSRDKKAAERRGSGSSSFGWTNKLPQGKMHHVTTESLEKEATPKNGYNIKGCKYICQIVPEDEVRISTVNGYKRAKEPYPETEDTGC